MTPEVANNERIAKNTLLLYLRMLIVICINLYASRVLLVTLGIDDYGIFTVVGGIVTMFGFLNNAMVSASQRFISFEQGRGNASRQRTIYSTTVLIHWAIALLMVILVEASGPWFFDHRLNIPADRVNAARWVLQGAILVSLFRIVNVPSQASVIAHEHMHIFAIVSITDAALQLAAIFLLKTLSHDKLICYSLLIAGVSAFDYLFYKVYTLLTFKECRFQKPRDWGLVKEMVSFAGWSFVGNIGIAVRGPGVNIIVNHFFGPAVNAAKGIAYQVSSVVSNFVTSFQTAVDPQITKRYAAGESSSMVSLIKTTVKFSFFLLAIVVVPLFIRAGQVLDLWLVDVPDMAVPFLRLTLIVALFNSMAGPFTTGLQATGRIKVFQITIAVIMLLELPIAYLLLKAGVVPYAVMWVTIAIEIAALIARILLLNRQIPIGMQSILVSIIGWNLFVFLLMMSVPLALNCRIPESFPGLLLLCAISLVWSLATVTLVGMNREERARATGMLKRFLKV